MRGPEEGCLELVEGPRKRKHGMQATCRGEGRSMSHDENAAMTRQEPLLALLGLEPGEAFKADLHAHTVVSDGSDTLAELLGKSRIRGVTHQAITNHDTTRGLNNALSYAWKCNFTVIPGIEVSACNPATGRRIHVLGLGVREGAPALEQLCAPTLERRTANTCWQLDRLLDAGYDVDLDKAASFASASTAFYRQHLLASVTDAPFVSEEYQSLMNDLFKNGGVCDRDIEYVDMRDAVKAIREDGGLPVLAHPAQFDSYGAVPELVDAGLAGIETFHYTNGVADERACKELAERYGLFVTGGSDYHGRFGKPPYPGYRSVGC